MVPQSGRIGALVNPNRPDSDAQVREIHTAAETVGQQLIFLRAGTERDLDNLFTTFVEQRVGALLVAADPFFANRRAQLIALIERYAIPAIYQFREFSVAGGLMSYGASLPESYRLAGMYTGRVLKGEKPADLPVIQPTRFELVINLKTAKALGLTIPDRCSARRRGDRVRRREFITLLGGAAVHGRLRRARSSPSGCGASACSCPQPQTIRNFNPGSGRSCRRWLYWAGPSAATCASTPAGPRPMPPKFADTRRNWSRSHRTSSWPRHRDRGAIAAGNPHSADRVPDRHRSGRRRSG